MYNTYWYYYCSVTIISEIIFALSMRLTSSHSPGGCARRVSKVYDVLLMLSSQDMTSCFVLSCRCCEPNWRQVKTVFSSPDLISRLDKTCFEIFGRQHSLVAISLPVLFIPPIRTRQEQWCSDACVRCREISP